MKPILFSIGPVHVFSYGVMVALGVFIALQLLIRRARRDGFPSPDAAYDYVFVTLVAGFLGARIFYVLQNFSYYAAEPVKIAAIWEGGLVFQGGIAGALLGLWIASKRRGHGFLAVLDFLIPYVALTHAFGRIGCFLNGCCYGRFCELPWAVQFAHPPHPVHPTQLYEAFLDVLLFLFLSRAHTKPHQSGKIFMLYCVGYGLIRFVVEFWRADNPMFGFFSLYQWISLLLITAGILFLFVLKKKAAPLSGKKGC